MTIANAAVAGPVVQVPCIGGGFMTTAVMSCTLTVAATHPLAPLLAALGAPAGSAVAIYDAGSDVDMEINTGGAEITPYLDFAAQALEYRRVDNGTINASNVVVAGADRVFFNLIVID